MVEQSISNPVVEHDFESCACNDSDTYCDECVAAGIREKISSWQSHGERGLSSDTLANATLASLRGRDPRGRDPLWVPLDPGDLRRCMLLQDEVPEVGELGVLYLAHVSEHWNSLAGIWELLGNTLKWELGGSLNPVEGSIVAPQTSYLMMRARGSNLQLTTTNLLDYGNHRIVRRTFPVQFGVALEGIGDCANAIFTPAYNGWICGSCGDLLDWELDVQREECRTGCSCEDCLPYICFENGTTYGCVACEDCNQCGKSYKDCKEDGCKWTCPHICKCECEASDDHCDDPLDCEVCDTDGCQCSNDQNSGGECKDPRCYTNRLFVNGGEVEASSIYDEQPTT